VSDDEREYLAEDDYAATLRRNSRGPDPLTRNVQSPSPPGLAGHIVLSLPSWAGLIFVGMIVTGISNQFGGLLAGYFFFLLLHPITFIIFVVYQIGRPSAQWTTQAAFLLPFMGNLTVFVFYILSRMAVGVAGDGPH
jgi:hypothetical protein